MDITIIAVAVASLGGVGLLLGLGLGYASKAFAVEEDPRIDAIVAALPGANCGGCGFAGCGAFAKAVIKGTAQSNGCPVISPEGVEKIAEIMGVEVVIGEKQVAFVKCNGNSDVSQNRYEYHGMLDCNAAAQLAGGGSKACDYACLGGGTCKAVCPFDAIAMVDGIAVINKELCVSCGACVPACPKALIDIIPHKAVVTVACNSKDAGKVVRQHCSVGCIACKLCEKACQYDAIHVVDNIAIIDYEKCTYCNDCVKKCPTGTINSTTFTKPKKETPQEKKTAETTAEPPTAEAAEAEKAE